MTDITYSYGLDVIEFFKHDDTALQQLVNQRTAQYHRHSESPAYPQPGAHIDWFSDKPLTQALNDMLEWTNKGYGIAAALHQPLYLKVQLRKPEKLIKADLGKLGELVRAEYDKSRHERNVAETARQIELSISMQRRKAEAKAAAEQAEALAAQQASEEAAALADLRRAYTQPATGQ